MSKENDLFGDVNLGTIELDTIIDTEEVSSSDVAKSGEDAAKDKGEVTETKPKVDVKVTDPLQGELLEVEDVPVESTTGEDNKEEEEKGKGKGEGTEKSTPSSETKDSNSSSSPESQPFAALSKKLFDDGYLTQFDDDEFKKILEENDNDPEVAFGEVIKRTVEDIHEDWIAQYPQQIQDLLRAAQANIPVDKMFAVKQEQMKLEGITEDKLKEDAELRKQLLIEHRRATTKLSDEKIKKDVQRIIDAGQDEEEAIEAHADLKKLAVDNEKKLKEDALKQKQLAESKRVENLELMKQSIYNTKEIIPSIALTKKEQDEIFKSMTTAVQILDNGRRLTDVDVFFTQHPLEARKALHYYFQKGLFKVDDKGVFTPDFSKITNTLKTAVTKEIKSNAEKSRVFKSGTPGDEKDAGQKVNIGDSLSKWLKSKEEA
jgi:hypothetical protein